MSVSVSSRGTLGISSISSVGNRVSEVGGNGVGSGVSAGRSNPGVGIGVVGNSPFFYGLIVSELLSIHYSLDYYIWSCRDCIYHKYNYWTSTTSEKIGLC